MTTLASMPPLLPNEPVVAELLIEDEPSTAPPPVAMAADNMSSASPMASGPPPDPAPVDDTRRLAIDLMSGKPILSQLTTAITTGDEHAIEGVLTRNGYNATVEGISALLQTAAPGPGFDIKMAGALYSFHTPANLIGTQMRIDPLTGRLFMSETWVQNTTDTDGNVLFDYSQMSYSLDFSVSYDANGVPQPFTFTGHRNPMGSLPSDPVETVSGQQVVPPPPQPAPQEWSTTPGWSDASVIITIFGGGIPLLLNLIRTAKEKLKERKEGKNAELAKELEAQKAKYTRITERFLEAAKAVAELSQPLEDFDVAHMENRINQAIDMEVQLEMNRQLPEGAGDAADFRIDEAKMRKAVQDKVKETIAEAYKEQHEEEILSNFNTFNEVLSDAQKAQAVDDIVSGRLANVPMFKDPASVDWVKDITDMHVAARQAEAAEERGYQARNAAEEARAEMEAARAKMAEREQQRQQYVDEHASKPSRERPTDYEEHIRELQDQVDELDAAARQAEKSASDSEERARKEKQRERDEIDRHDEAERAAEREGPEGRGGDHGDGDGGGEE